MLKGRLKTYHIFAKAVVIEGEAEIRDDTDGSFAKKMYERYAGKNALDNPIVQASVIMPRYILTIRPVKVMSWDPSKIPKMSN